MPLSPRWKHILNDQTKQQINLPKVSTVKVTDKQVLKMSATIDSLANVLSNTALPANFVKAFTISLYGIPEPIYGDIRKYLADSLQVVKKKP